MANEIKTVEIAEITSVNEKFANIKGTDGIAYGIGKEKSPKLYEILSKAKVGDKVEGQYWSKDNKHYLFDPKSNTNGAGRGLPRDRSFDASGFASNAAAQIVAFNKGDKAMFDDWFDHIHKKCMEKVTIQPTPPTEAAK